MLAAPHRRKAFRFRPAIGLRAEQRTSRLLFRSSQIYRIDHYLGKETVQNIMVLRFANGMFEPIWNRHHIDHVQITVAETVSVESRGKFYDSTGALRDMVPNHLFQLLALTAMEPPSRFEADAVRAEKLKAIEAIHPLNKDSAFADVVRGQYTAGSVKGKPVVAYREAPGVSPQSVTETYVAMRLMIDNWRWAGVPFYLRTGKALAATQNGNCHQIPQRAAGAVPRYAGRKSGAKSFDLADSARRRSGAAFQRQDSRTRRPHRKRADEFQVRGLFRCGAEHRLRDADLRLHDRRLRCCSSAPSTSRPAGAWSTPFSRPGARPAGAICTPIRREAMDQRRRRALLSRSGQQWRPIT